MSVPTDAEARHKTRRFLARLEGGISIAAGIAGYFLIGHDVFPGTSIKGWWLCVLLVVVGLNFILFPNARWIREALDKELDESDGDAWRQPAKKDDRE